MRAITILALVLALAATSALRFGSDVSAHARATIRHDVERPGPSRAAPAVLTAEPMLPAPLLIARTLPGDVATPQILLDRTLFVPPRG